jgi:hypothetical protein
MRPKWLNKVAQVATLHTRIWGAQVATLHTRIWEAQVATLHTRIWEMSSSNFGPDTDHLD